MRRSKIVFLAALIAMLNACGAETSSPSSGGSAANPATAGTVVDAQGTPLAGAMVTANLANRTITVFADGNGHFDLPDATANAFSITIKHPGFETTTFTPERAAQYTLAPVGEPLVQVPSSHWLQLLPDGPMRREFILNCASCHEISQPRIFLGGRPRTPELWHAAMIMMRAIDVYSVIPPDFDDKGYADWLAEHLDEEAISQLQPAEPPTADLAERLVITEYELPVDGSLPHDLVVGPHGRIWITGFLNDVIWALDPETGDYETFSVDDDPDVNAQPRALEFASDGRLWVVNGETRQVLRLDTETGSYEAFDVDMYAHSLDLDVAGNVWANDYFADKERIARIDQATGKVDTIAMPSSDRPTEEGLPLPYGLQVDQASRLYSTQLAANTLIVYDTASTDAQLVQMPAPNSGPRRPGVAPDGTLWIPEFNTGHVTQYDPVSQSFQRVDLGNPALGAYDVEVNQGNGDVWITGSLDASLIRLQPESRKISRIPLPTPPAYSRHIAIDAATGDAWTAYSSLPAANPRVARIQFRD